MSWGESIKILKEWSLLPGSVGQQVAITGAATHLENLHNPPQLPVEVAEGGHCGQLGLGRSQAWEGRVDVGGFSSHMIL